MNIDMSASDLLNAAIGFQRALIPEEPGEA